ncbi:hypothetical protein T265_10201 [Opisthorchis viverrini]|uniref:Uncharacterized protein n=1 Tax=Opisthorchis viverrini TaxID=6198 RepID=A0A075A260_OPIVI|nr:hypothetical protein T265_10201 [Opisthorchis viverrini]KER21489.1 hypothetical protein T265_10201 [Opisthorchis viverrini]
MTQHDGRMRQCVKTPRTDCVYGCVRQDGGKINAALELLELTSKRNGIQAKLKCEEEWFAKKKSADWHWPVVPDL